MQSLTIAMAVGVISASNLRRGTDDVFQTTKLGMRDSSFLEALATKYNCREAGASLEQTIASVRAKNEQEEKERQSECELRRTQYTTPWTTAQNNYDHDFPLVATDEAEKEQKKIEDARTAYNTAESTLTQAVTTASDAVDAAQTDFDTKNNAYIATHSAHAVAVKTAADAEKEYQEVTKPAADKRINDAFTTAKNLADNLLETATTTSNKAKAEGIQLCTDITSARNVHITTDETLLNEQIAPLIQELSQSKCVDELNDNNFEEKKVTFHTKLKLDTTCTGEVEVFQHVDFSGSHASFGKGNHAIQEIQSTIGIDKISSLKVPRGCVANIYKNGGSAGTKVTFVAGEYDMTQMGAMGVTIGDVSSIKVFDAGEEGKHLAATTLLEETASSEIKAKCALTSSKAQSFLETTHYLGSLPLDAQFKVFTDRVQAEKDHMNDLNAQCLTNVNNNYDAEMTTATEHHAVSIAAATKIKEDDLKFESDTYDDFTRTNNANIETKAAAMVEPLRLKNDANTALVAAKADLNGKENTKESEMAINLATRDETIRQAGATKTEQIETRQSTLNQLKATAEATWKSDKSFVEDYCTSTEADLKKERDILDRINSKLVKLRVTNTAEVGKTDAETSRLEAFAAEDAAAGREDAEDACPANVDGDCRQVPGNGPHAVKVCNNGIRIIQHTKLSDRRFTANEQKYKCTGYASGGWGVHQAHDHDCTATSPETATESKMWTNTGHTYGCSYGCTPITCV